MSLHAAAQHLAAQGRGGDDQLVHMSTNEVRSLQDLAKAHGTSLTINPKTGLTEALSLQSFLPMAAGAAMTGLSGGAINPMTAGLIMGGLGYASTGSLTKGLTMGLGAYGGAGLGEGLANMGASAETSGNMLQSGLNKAGIDMAPSQYNALSDVEKARLFTTDASGSIAPDISKQQLFSQGMSEAAANPVKPSLDTFKTGISEAISNPSAIPAGMGGWGSLAKYGASALSPVISEAMQPKPLDPFSPASSPNPVYTYNRGTATPMPSADPYGVEQTYFPTAGYVRTAAAGGSISSYAEGGPAMQGLPAKGPIEQMSNANSVGQNTGYPQADIRHGAYATPWQTPISRNMLEGAADTGVNPITGEMNFAGGGTALADQTRAKPDDYIQQAYEKAQSTNDIPKLRKLENERSIRASINSGMTKGLRGEPGILGTKGLYAAGGLSDLGGYSDGGRLLRGPGDGVSDSIPAVIGHKQPARLADGEFVVPARIVSEIGNGSTEAGARKLYAMMDRVQKARAKTTGKGRVAKNTNADRYLPA